MKLQLPMFVQDRDDETTAKIFVYDRVDETTDTNVCIGQG